MEPQFISSKKSKLVLFVFVSVLFVATGIWLLFFKENIRFFGFTSTLLPKIIGATSILLFGITSVMHMKNLLAKNAGITFTEDGFECSSMGLVSGFIKWDEVSAIRDLTMVNQKMVVVDLKDFNQFLERQNGSLKKYFLKLNQKRFNAGITISAQTLQIDHTQLYSSFSIWFDEFKSNKTVSE